MQSKESNRAICTDRTVIITGAGGGLGRAYALAFAALWLGQEAFRGWFLTGFPWLYSGYSQLDGPLTGLAPVGGMWLISFAMALTAGIGALVGTAV